MLSFFLPGPREIPLFIYIELCRPLPLPGSPACCCNIGAAGDLRSQRDPGRGTQITPAPWLLHSPVRAHVSVCVCVSPERRGTLWLVRTSFLGLGLDCTVEITGRHLVVIVKVRAGAGGLGLFYFNACPHKGRETRVWGGVE